MKFFLAASALASLANTVNGAGVGTFFTYFEEGGLGPNNWKFLDMEGNQCGGTQGMSGYGQSPVTITADVAETCDTDMASYKFKSGDCTWNELEFSISNNGTFTLYICLCFLFVFVDSSVCRLEIIFSFSVRLINPVISLFFVSLLCRCQGCTERRC